MSSALDMSLEDLISRNKRSDGGRSSFRGRGRGSGPGPARRFSDRGVNRASPYTTAKPFQARNPLWQNDMFIDRATSIETGAKLYISNLDYGVTNEDLKELFSEVGELKRYSIHYDRSGRSKGTAEVVLSRHADAVSAVKRYNNVQLDGKPMKMEIVGTNVATPATFPPVANSMLGNLNGVSRSWQGRRGTAGQPRGGGGGGGGGSRGRGFGRGRGRGRGRGEQVSAEDLDAELEKYHAEAMQIN